MGTQDRVSSTGRKNFLIEMTASQGKLSLIFSVILFFAQISYDDRPRGKLNGLSLVRDKSDISPKEVSSFHPNNSDCGKSYFLEKSLSLLLCGDVKPHPGPKRQKEKENLVATNEFTEKRRRVGIPCLLCDRGITKASKKVPCLRCDRFIHQRCAQISDDVWKDISTGKRPSPFMCDACCLKNLPFYDTALGDEGVEALWERPQCHTGTTSSTDENDSLSNIFGKKGLHFMHLNIRSLIPKLAEVRSLIQRTGAAVVAISETWLDETVQDAEVDVDGYSVIRQDRNRQGGGVLLYIKSGISFNQRSDLAVKDLEMVAVDLLLPKSKPFLISSCYRPPNDQSFLEKLETSLSKVDLSGEFYILGDINIDFKNKSSALYKRYVQLLSAFNCKQLISEATRVTDNTSTILDHVITNSKDKISKSGVLDCSLSDHLPIFFTRGSIKTNFSRPIIKRIRSLKNYSKEFLISELKKVSWGNVFLAPNVDESLAQFIALFNGVLDVVAPIRDIKVKQKTEPWFNGEILAGIRQRDALFRRWRNDKNDVTVYKDYCRIRNKLQRDIKKAKEFYFHNQLTRNKDDSRKLWSHLKGLGYGTFNKDGGQIVLEDGGKKLFDMRCVANCFNHFYTTVAADLVKLLPTPSSLFSTASSTFRNFYNSKRVFPDSFFLSPVSRHYILKQLNSLKKGKSTGLDGLSPRFLRDGACVLSEPITHLVNLSITSEAVPSGFKDARVKPIFKKGSKLLIRSWEL